MALNSSTLVDIPSGCHKVPVKGTTYIYLHLGSHKNENGQNINERVAIGKLDPDSGKLVPNEKYYYYFPEKRQYSEPNLTLRCGSYAVFKKYVEDLNLFKDLEKAFGKENTEKVLSLAHYMLKEGSIMYYFSDFIEDSMSFSDDVLESPEISKLFESLSEENRRAFFNDWIKHNKNDKECLAYDVTSISSYSDTLESLENGYNRDKENLPQINLGMFVGSETKLPLYYRYYPGSINDKTHLEYMSKDLKDLEIKKAYFLMDGGFHSEENMKYMSSNGIRFVIGLPTNLKIVKDLIDKRRNEIVGKSANKMGNSLVYGKEFRSSYYGFRMNVHLYYDPEKAALNEETLYNSLDKMEADLADMETAPGSNTNMSKFFNITEKETVTEVNGKEIKHRYLVFERNAAAIDEALARCGFFAIAETVFTKSSKEILDLYRDRDMIEKCFDDMKNRTDLKRLHCRKEETVSGKLFVAFISQVILSRLRLNLGNYLDKENMTMKKALLELDKIKIQAVPTKKEGEKTYRLLNPITKKQRLMLEQMGMDETIFDNLR